MENKYVLNKEIDLIRRYRVNGEGSKGGKKALRWYQCGIVYGKKSDEYDQKNYEYSYNCQKHYPPYERRGLRNFKRAAICFCTSAELGNELAMMNYALYLFAFKREYQEALKWFLAASEAGLATADYQLAMFYKTGECGVAVDEEKSEFYLQRYKARCAEDERQSILASGIEEWDEAIGRPMMYAWFCGRGNLLWYDTPGATPSEWRYKRQGE